MLSQSSYSKVPWLSNTNTLLVKDDVGRAKPSTYDLPERRFIYGKPLDRDPENAKEGVCFSLVSLIFLIFFKSNNGMEIS